MVLEVHIFRAVTRGFPMAIDDYAKDGGEEVFAEMHCVLESNPYRIVKDSQ